MEEGQTGGKEKSAAVLRQEKLSLRRKMGQSQRERQSRQIARAVQACPVWQNARCILLYASYKTEVSTDSLLMAALDANKSVYYPRVEGQEMEFYRIASREELAPGYKGILEPVQSGEKYVLVPDTLLIAPGAVFDRQGHRIGYGGGYYDRYLGRFAKPQRPYCMGLCFACQITPKIVPKAHDILMDSVIFA